MARVSTWDGSNATIFEAVGSCLAVYPWAMQLANEPSAIPPDKDLLKIAFDHTWEWTNAYYDTRIRAVQYYVAANAFLVAGYATTLTNRSGVAAVIAFAGAVSSMSFFMMDRRVKSYVQNGERALIELEDRVAAELGIDSLRLIQQLRGDAVNRPSQATWVAWSLSLVATLLWLGVAIYALV